MATQALTLKQYIDNPTITDGLEHLLGKKNAQALKTTVLNIASTNKQLQECTPRSIMGAAVCATTMNLSITPGLGHAYIVPFNGQATFQIGFKGLIQLAHRTRQYVALHAGKIYEGELAGFNPFTGEPIQGEKISDTVVGYVAYFRLVNGCEKYLYMTVDEIKAHAEKYSKSYAYDVRSGKRNSIWNKEFDAMASKTVLKKLLGTWGILSTEMATAIQADQSVVDRETFTYVDNGGNTQKRNGIYVPEPEEALEVVDAETGEVISEGQVDGTNDSV